MATKRKDNDSIEPCIQQTNFFFHEIYRLEKVSTPDYRIFYRLLLDICELILLELKDLKTGREELEGLPESSIVEATKRAVIREAKDLFWIVSQLQLYLKLLNMGTGREENIPVEFIFPLEKIIDRIQKNNLLFLVASWELNYFIIDFSDVLNDLFESDPQLLRIVKKYTKQYKFNSIIIIILPYAWKEAALMHPLLFHEIGHLVVKHFSHKSETESKILIDNKRLKRTVDAIYSKSNENSSDEERNLPYFLDFHISKEIVTSTSYNWIKEIKCDLFGLLVMSCGFIFAFTSFFRTSTELTICSPSHPPTFLRLNIIYHKLKRNNQLCSFLKSISLNVFQILEDSSDKWDYYLSQLEEPYRTCAEIVSKYGEQIIDVDLFEKKDLDVEPFKYNHEDFEKYKNDLFKLLLHFIPINEILVDEKESYQCNLALIINTGWIFFHEDDYNLFCGNVENEGGLFESRYSRALGPGISRIHKDKEIPALREIYGHLESESLEERYHEEEIDPFLSLNSLIYKSIELSFIQEYLKEIREIGRNDSYKKRD